MPTYLGVSGIVVQETTQTFKVITEDDKLVVLPKRGTLFTFVFADKAVTVFGNHIIAASAERSRKKFKIKNTLEL